MRSNGYLLIFTAALLWGMIGPVAKVALASGMQPLEIAFWRTSIGWFFFAVHAISSRQYRIGRKDLFWVLAFGVLGVAGLFGNYVVAVRTGGAALAAVLLYTAPAWVALLSRLLLGETMTPLKLASVALTILGVAAVCMGQGGSMRVTPAAVFFGLASGFSYALYYVFGKRFLGSYATPTLFLLAMPAGAVVMLPFFEFSAHPPQAWISVFVLGLGSTYLAYSIYYAGLKYLEATRAAVAATLEPVAAAVLAYIWWDEYFNLLGYAGSGLILGAVLLTMYDGARQRRLASKALLTDHA